MVSHKIQLPRYINRVQSNVYTINIRKCTEFEIGRCKHFYLENKTSTTCMYTTIYYKKIATIISRCAVNDAAMLIM